MSGGREDNEAGKRAPSTTTSTRYIMMNQTGALEYASRLTLDSRLRMVSAGRRSLAAAPDPEGVL